MQEEKKIPAATIKELRDQSGAGIMECRSALLGVEGDIEKALDLLKQRSLLKAEKKANRATNQGLVEAYIHTRGRIGALVELNCETDFVARTEEFKELSHQLAMQVAALSPRFISEEEIPEGDDVEPQIDCLLCQTYIKDPDKTVQDLINETIAKVGENIKVNRIARFGLGE